MTHSPSSLFHSPALRSLREQRQRRLRVLIGLSLAGSPFMHAANAAGVLPQGGQYVAGAGTIAGQGATLTVTQPGSTRGVIDWNSFSIGKNNTVTFDNGTGATLNRVTGCAPSALLGSLSATGSVYLINPQGIVIGRGGVISTGGRFVASTLDLPDAMFMTGSPLTLTGSSHGTVVNLGKISSSGGDVFLIARDVVLNDGSVNAPAGSAELVVGQTVVLTDSSTSRQVAVQMGSKGTVIDSGATQAAQINLEAADGNIYALAGGGSRIRATGTATRDGHVWLVADTGHVMQEGTLAAINADGSGGTVDTLAATFSFAPNAAVHAGMWNISTDDLTVDPGMARAFRRSLNTGTSVDASATGDLSVASNVDWKGGASLSLAAGHDVSVANGVTLANRGSGNLNVRADSAGIDNGGSVASLGTIDWSKSTGMVSLFYDMNGSYSPGTLVSNSAWTAAPFSGYLTQITAYKLVNSMADLQNMAIDLAGTYALGRDIDATSSRTTTFSPIGSAATPFTGQFDGMGHVIDNFYQRGYAGLFGVIGSAAVVRNVGMTNADIGTNDYTDGTPYGILADQNEGLITYAYSTGTMDAPQFEGAVVGGLVGRNDGLLERSYSGANVNEAGTLGGLAGVNYGTVTQSYASGNVSPNIHGFGGGLVGTNYGMISESYTTGTTFGEIRAGGLVFSTTGTIQQSFAAGLVEQPQYLPPDVGAFYGAIAAGANDGTLAPDVYWDKEITTRTMSTGSGFQLPASNGLTTAQMSNPASFSGWDFSATGVWAMPAGATHPVLSWQVGH